jgi:hypothetical protein
MSMRIGGIMILDEITVSPSAPPTGFHVGQVYAKSNGHLYLRNEAGSEFRCTGNDRTDTGWIAPSLQNGWTNYGSGWVTAGYRKQNGIVLLRGLIAAGTFVGAPVLLFTLPVGFRPAEHIMFAVAVGSIYQNTNPTTPSGGVSHVHADQDNGQTARLTILSTGNVYYEQDSVTSPIHFNLDTARFVAEA